MSDFWIWSMRRFVSFSFRDELFDRTGSDLDIQDPLISTCVRF
jgi:hypothetical protein